MRIHLAIVSAAVVAITTAATFGLSDTVGAQPHAPAPSASCVASVTVAETQIAPGFVGDEVRGIAELGPSALPTLVRQLATHHLGDAESCAALVGE